MQPSVARSVFSALPRLATALALAAALLAPLAASGVTIDWVTVGTPGNAADTAPNPNRCGPSGASPCGAVAYTYNIGKYEVTNAQYAEFLNKVAATDTNALYNTGMGYDATFGGITQSGVSGSYSYSVKSGFESKPVTYVSFWDAARFSNWLQNGQPTGLQASLTTEDGTYTGNSANCYPYDYTPGTLTDVGAYALSGSPSGTFDQGGNVWEWHEQIKYGSNRGLRGGAWLYYADGLAAGNSRIDYPALGSYSIGFRVASIPEPSTALLVLTGLLGLAARRRRCS